MFNWGDFKSNSGQTLPFKINCDDLTDSDLDCIAMIITARVKVKHAIGVPKGGLRFAKALNKYSSKDGFLVIADDVITTGQSMNRMRALNPDYMLGIVIFSRGDCPNWVKSIFEIKKVWREFASII